MGIVPQIIKPDQDGQYRLRPCKCSNHMVAYTKRTPSTGGVEWAAGCQVCGKMTRWYKVQHHAQIEWNGSVPPSWERD